jgi:5-formyltetrahydrofolate cyclo-ligase
MSLTPDLAAWRKAERARLLSAREAMPVAERRTKNERITRFVIDGFPCLRGRSIGFCWPYKAEPDVRFAIRHFRDLGSTAALPVVLARAAPLEFREWWPGVTTTPGVFDLPVPQSAVVHPAALLVPPIGFGSSGFRLGYGGGYFDRTLAALSPRPLAIAIAFEVSRMETIHPQPHDIAMDFIVTENGIFEVTPDGLVALRSEAADARAALLLSDRGF